MSHQIEISPLLDQTPLTEATKDDETQVSREGDCRIKIWETDRQDQLRMQANKSAKQIFDEIVKDLEESSTKSCTMFKVNMWLRESNPDAYTPKLISIGPYHKKNPQLHPMEKYKLRYLQRFLKRREGIDGENCIRELEKLKDEALNCYDNIDDLDTSDSSDGYLKMLLLDGCFVVEYIREFFGMVPKGEDKIINTDWMEGLVDRDLLLLENQLPFFVLTKLHDMTKEGTESFITMVKINFSASLPKVNAKFIRETDVHNAKEIKHLLQVIHMCYCPPKTENSRTSMKTKRSKKSSRWNRLQIGTTTSSKKVQKDKDCDIWHDLMPCAIELDEAGIDISNVGSIYRRLDSENEDSIRLFDIKFDNGRLKIPCFEVVDSTETVLRNLVAYEQHSYDVYPKYFTDYVVFMDRLIDSDKDVNLLRMNGIIRNRIGDDKEVACIFNKLREGVVPSTDFYYRDTCKEVVEHCEKPWNKRMANFWHNYFNGPWVGLSTAAAVVLLVLTFTQTVLAFISTL